MVLNEAFKLKGPFIEINQCDETAFWIEMVWDSFNKSKKVYRFLYMILPDMVLQNHARGQWNLRSTAFYTITPPPSLHP